VLAEDSGSSDSGSAMQQLQEADQDGKEAVQALERGDEEKAKEESSETFDTPHDSDGD